MGDRSPPPRRSRSRSPPRGGDPRDAKPSEGTPGEFGGMGGERKSGICVGWNHKGFGFIRPDEGGGDDLFCHATQIRDGNAIEKDAKVEFETVYDDRRGKHRAVEVSGGIELERTYFPPRDGRDDRRDDRRGGGDRYYSRDDRDRAPPRRDDRGYDRDRYDDRDRGYDRRGGYDDRDRAPPRRDDRDYDRRGYDDRDRYERDRDYERRPPPRREEYDDRRDSRPAPRDDYDTRDRDRGGYDERR
mmetsp:Transcript_4495/g.13206  ORF Transcript_4495/g.13206 Transcript_4495/m.13206 type:complete len:244 (+) Transcript_4495:58-789(+)